MYPCHICLFDELQALLLLYAALAPSQFTLISDQKILDDKTAQPFHTFWEKKGGVAIISNKIFEFFEKVVKNIYLPKRAKYLTHSQ